jgi:hypothetical protein
MLIVHADTEKAAGEQVLKGPFTCTTFQKEIGVPMRVLISGHTSDRSPFPQKTSNSESDK